jgi:hypothetical protein
MRTARAIALLALALPLTHAALPADGPNQRSPKQALQPFNELIGDWKGTGTPAGSRDQFWTETLSLEWQFKGTDAWLKFAFEKSRNFTGGELRYLADKDLYQLTLRPAAKEKVPLVFTGRLKNRVLTVERKDEKANETQRLVFRMLHPERFVYHCEAKKPGRALFSKVYQVGCTRMGVEFAKGDGRPECVVSGGLGTIQVSYMGQTYYVCCSGCRNEFNADPGKYVKEFNERKRKKK